MWLLNHTLKILGGFPGLNMNRVISHKLERKFIERIDGIGRKVTNPSQYCSFQALREQLAYHVVEHISQNVRRLYDKLVL